MAIAELVWNALDADALNVGVEFKVDFSGGITELIVTDDGTGIREADALSGFGHLGGSWKRVGNGLTRRDKRNLHGKEGQGRFAAFALGTDVEWLSISEEHDKALASVTIVASRDKLGEFRVSEPTVPKNGSPGTCVRVTGVLESTTAVRQDAAEEELLETFALYLKQYPHVAIRVDGTLLEPESLQASATEYTLPTVQVDGQRVNGIILTVVEWRVPTTRSLFLCNSKGIARLILPLPTVKAPGFEFTAYLQSDYVQELWDSNALLMGNTHPGVNALIDAAIVQIRDHFRRRAAEHATELVEEWKRIGIYPYQGEPATPLEQTERQVFDVVAVNVNEYLPDFASSDSKSKQFSLRLLRQGIESNPESMQRILTDVLGLPKTRQDELAALLEKTSLSAIITASKLIADRLNFLRALEIMLFESEPKKELLERRQLHRVLADHTWIFGEQYNLSADDESLEAVLTKHIQLMKRHDLVPSSSKWRSGPRLIVDLMLSQRIPHPLHEQREHLIVELKRPAQRLDEKVLGQITKYALAVAKDERFRDVDTRWSFWALSNDRDDYVDAQANQPHRVRGIVFQLAEPRITIWAKTWGELIEEARSRLELFREQLDYTADRETALASLRRTHEKYFPPSLRAPTTPFVDQDRAS
jgi:hypothetical protein